MKKPLSLKAIEQLRNVQEGNKGRHHTAESKLKMSLTKTGKPGHPHTTETKLKLSQNHKGIPFSPERRARYLAARRTPEWRLKMSLAITGKTHTAETKLKISQIKKSMPITAEQRAKMLAGQSKPEVRLKMSQAKKGIPLSAEHRLHISQANKGHPTSIETRQRISRAHKGVPLSTEHRQSIDRVNKARIGIPHSPEHNMKVAEASKRMWRKPGFHEKHSGANGSRWEGGKSFEHYSPEFNRWIKETIKNRDNNLCYLCSSTDRLCVHHIDYDKRNCDPYNLITLCRSCHAKTGYRRVYWIAHFQAIMKTKEMVKANSVLPCNKLRVKAKSIN
jgi:hypothetical protein